MNLTQLLDKLDLQEEEMKILIQDLNADQLNYEPLSGKWSIRLHLAHLGRYHEVFLLRLRQIMKDEMPMFERYKSEWDAGFSDWMPMSVSDIWNKMNAIRSQIKKHLKDLTELELGRQGNHPRLGSMDVIAWFEFFTLHESHHIYSIFRMVKMRIWETTKAN
ncbi:MAG: DinB family protein [Bacteroidota bacterium]